MKLCDIFENDSQTVRLYRGDASKIDRFETEKTKHSIGLLFGKGIYLTDNPEIALDYTVKGGYRRDGSGTVIGDGEAKTEAEAVSQYLMRILRDELKWKERQQEIKDDMLGIFYKEAEGIRGEEYNKLSKAFQEKFAQKVYEEFAKYVKKAKALYKSRRDTLKVFRDTTGGWRVMRKEHEGHITVFDIPQSYLDKTLHGDKPLNDGEIDLVRNFLKKCVGEENFEKFGDYRDRNNTSMPFDQWIEVFRVRGADYAWRNGEERMIGGKGVNPTLDEIWNGQHGGFSIFCGNPDKFIDMAKAAGYTGIEYNGGIRIGGNVRGGGGIRHQSFVFWDDDFINSSRTQVNAAEYAEPNPTVTKSIRSKTVYGDWSDDAI